MSDDHHTPHGSDQQAQLVVLLQRLLVDGCGNVAGVTPELRQLRSFVAVADRASFTAAAAELHVAQQAVSQHIKALERTLGVTLLRRTSRKVELTAEGVVFLADARRLLAGADRAVSRVQASARGEAGTVRLAYTLTTAYDTVPSILAHAKEHLPQLKIETREVFGGDLVELLEADRYDLALAPKTSYPRDIRERPIRNEPFCIAVGAQHQLAGQKQAALSALRHERLELWPREMAPGFYDAVVGACHDAGFEPERDEHAAGSTVWGNIARGQGVGLVVGSLLDQLPRGIRLIDLAPPPPRLTITAVWHQPNQRAAVARLIEITTRLAKHRSWL
jgi:DNA-binding transcriptional LysR family regulator